MPRENILTAAAARLGRIPFALARRNPFHPPHKALILQTCCLSQVMLATPLLAALGEAFPEARFDWAVVDWARPAIDSNRRVTEIVVIGDVDLRQHSWPQIGRMILRLHKEHYDTVFIPSRSSLLSYIAWQAGIPQRVGLNVQGRGFAHTIPVVPVPGVHNNGVQGLLLAEAVGVGREITGAVNMEYQPPDRDRTGATRRLIEEVDWLGDVPLVIIHPGGGVNPTGSRTLIRWPEERYVILGNYLAQAYGAKIVLAGVAEEKALADDIAGMMAGRVTNYCGRLSMGELGALCEVADLYIGNDTGTSHIAAATGCQTMVIYGPTDPAYSKPYSTTGNVHALWRDLSYVAAERPFTWDIGVTAEEAMEAADRILRRPVKREQTLAILSKRAREKN